jgi:hypothetical protein
MDIIRFAESICKLDLSSEQEGELKRLEQQELVMNPIRNNGYEQYAFFQNIVTFYLNNVRLFQGLVS